MTGSEGRRRWIHRRGAVFDATLRPPPPEWTPGAGAAEHERAALVRISSTFGWPRPLPDWAGMAIRVFGVDEGENQTESEQLDLLLASAKTEPELWCRLEAHRDVLACSFTSGVRHRIGGADQVVVATPTMARAATTLGDLIARRAPCPIAYRIDVTDTRGTWRSLGVLELTGQHEDDDPSLRFVPPGRGPRLFTAVRRNLYRLAQGRGGR